MNDNDTGICTQFPKVYSQFTVYSSVSIYYICHSLSASTCHNSSVDMFFRL